VIRCTLVVASVALLLAGTAHAGTGSAGAPPADATAPAVKAPATDDADAPFGGDDDDSGKPAPGHVIDEAGLAAQNDAIHAQDLANAARDAAAPSGLAPGEAKATAGVKPPDVLPALDAKDLPAPSGIGDLVGQLLKMVLMLGVVVALAYLTLSKGLGKLVERQSLGKRVKVVERVALDQKRSLYLVDVDGKQMLLGASDGGVVLIKDVDARTAAAVATGTAAAPGLGFAATLRRVVTRAPPASGNDDDDKKASA
jgi:flagellar protein FliO/FliZ